MDVKPRDGPPEREPSDVGELDVEPARFADAVEHAADDEAPDEVSNPVFADQARDEPHDDDGAVGGAEHDAHLLDANPDAGPLAPAQALPTPGRAPPPGRASAPGPGQVARGRDRFVDTTATPPPATPGAPAGPGVGAYTGARGEAALPPKFVVRVKPPDFTGSGTAPPPVACPACGVNNANDATTCGRCGGVIPPPLGIGAPPPEARGGAFSPGAALAIRAGPAEAPPQGDVLDALPEDVRAKVVAARERNEAHTVAATRRDRARQVQIVAAISGLALFAGLGMSAFMMLDPGAMLLVALVDVALAGTATWWIERNDSTSMHGMVLFGAAALLTGGLRILLGAATVPAFLGMVLWTAGSLLVGRLLGQHVLDRPSSGL